MTLFDRTLGEIYGALDETNAELSAGRRLDRSQETVLFGSDASLDSMGLVNLIVIVEQRLQDAFGVTIVLADERAMSQRSSPFRTVGTLAEYAEQRLREAGAR